jgi:hypothetical protein
MVLIQLLLPTKTPDGADAMAALAETRRELAAEFDGVTAYVRSPAKGLWTAPDGRTEADDVVMIEVVTERFDRGWWRGYAETLAGRFRQESIHVRALAVEMLEGTEGDAPGDGEPGRAPARRANAGSAAPGAAGAVSIRANLARCRARSRR